MILVVPFTCDICKGTPRVESNVVKFIKLKLGYFDFNIVITSGLSVAM